MLTHRASLASEISRFAPALALALGMFAGTAGCLAPAADDHAEVAAIAIDPISGARLTHAHVCSEGRFRCTAELVARDGITAQVAAVGFGPPDLQSMYTVDPARGAGVTIAVVDSYGYAALEKDLATYRKTYGLPACTTANGCLRIVNQTGAASPLPAPSAGSDDWTVETALDVDMVSAVCPRCNILVVQGDVDNDPAALYEAQNAAVVLGATAISNSWTGPEYAGEDADDAAYFTHPGVGVFGGTGDWGYDAAGEPDYTGPQFPSTSLHVVGVGGTSVVKSTNSRGWSETAWTETGSSCSALVGKPSYQRADSGCTGRAASDVSAVADPNTGLAVYNAASGGWIEVGGTSAATPIVAALMAAAGHGDVTPDYFYAHPTLFHDVTSGKNGPCGTKICDAAAGWDGPTGVGTPNQAKLAADPSGHGGGSAVAPTASIAAPAAGATVAPGFEIDVAAGSGVSTVHLAIDGANTATSIHAPFTFTAPATLADGAHELVITAYDAAGDEVMATVTVTVASDPAAANGETQQDVAGCAVGGGGGGALLLVAAAVVGVGARRRRRFALAATVVVGLAGSAAAEPIARVTIDPRTGDTLTHEPAHCKAGRWSCGSQRIARNGITAHVAAVGFAPADIQSMYAIDPTRGAGLTIAVVDAYGYTALEKDLGVYRKQYGLPACTVANGCLTIVNQAGATSPLPKQGTGTDGDGWMGETALDVDMVSAVCPLCKIIVVQGDVDNDQAALYEAQNAAVMLGATAISNSWSGPEYDGLDADDAAYFTHPGVGIFACTGDYGYDMLGDPDLAGPQFPATSTHVVGVGGTHVVKSTNTRGWAESAWTSAGSSCSTHVAKPAYQAADSGCAFRAASDVSAIADPDTGVAIYNAAQGGWLEYGGTSVATPVVTSLMAAAGHGDATPDFFYAHAAIFHDVTSGKNGLCGTKVCDAGAGWDGPSGNGTPNQDKILAVAGGGGGGSGSGSGSAGSGAAPPTVAISAPAANATVAPGFTIAVDAGDDVVSVHLAIDGADAGSLVHAPFAFTAPASLVDGAHELVVTAYDAAGAQAMATVDVTLDSASSGSGSGSGDGETDPAMAGCAARGGGGGGGAAALVLVAAAVGSRRRRR